jgi:predicted kinase
VCYKPFMRKWMRERMKRRKPKAQEQSASSDPGQTPLQPAYFEEPAASEEEAIAEPPAAPQEQANPESVEAADPQPERGRGTSEGPARRRRRRGRGGRGRGKTQTPPAPLQPTLMHAEEASAAPVAPPSQPSVPPAPRSPKGAVVLAIGLPGSGKSSWFKRHSISPLSSDLLRSLLFDDPTEQRFQDLVFSNLRSMLKARLIARRPLNYVDATNLSPQERHAWIKMARDYGYEVHAVFFDVPVDVCLERNQRRKRVVSEDVMRRMASKLRAPTFEEGFAKITVVRVKKKDGQPSE